MTDESQPSLYEEYRSTDEGARELAAADAASQALGILEEALHLSGMTQKDLAEKLGLTEGRVSQVLNGDGNLRVGVLSRYLDALGFALKLSADSHVEGSPSLPLPKRGQRSNEPARAARTTDPCQGAIEAWASSLSFVSQGYQPVSVPVQVHVAFVAMGAAWPGSGPELSQGEWAETYPVYCLYSNAGRLREKTAQDDAIEVFCEQ